MIHYDKGAMSTGAGERSVNSKTRDISWSGEASNFPGKKDLNTAISRQNQTVLHRKPRYIIHTIIAELEALQKFVRLTCSAENPRLSNSCARDSGSESCVLAFREPFDSAHHHHTTAKCRVENSREARRPDSLTLSLLIGLDFLHDFGGRANRVAAAHPAIAGAKLEPWMAFMGNSRGSFGLFPDVSDVPASQLS